MTYRPPARKPFEYGELIKGTFRLVWRHKYLWFFGFFVISNTGFNFRYTYSSSDTTSSDTGSGDIFSEIGDWMNAHLALVLSLVAAAVILGLVIWLWSILCQGAVIRSIRDIRLGEPSSFGQAFRNGKQSFGRLLLFNLFLILLFAGIVIIFLAIVLSLAFLSESGEAGDIVAGVLAAIITLLVVGIMLSSFGYLFICTFWIVGPLLFFMVVIYSMRAVALEGLRPVAALRRGLNVLLENLSRTLLLFLISLGLTIGAGIGIILVIAIAAIPSGVGWIVAYNLDFTVLWVVVASILAVPAFLLLIVVSALSNTYFATYWTDAYLYFTGVIENFQAPEPDAPPPPPAAEMARR